jgi:phosphomannomutase/phosphoglucomutase
MLADIPPTVATPEIRVQCDDERKFEVVRRIRERYGRTYRVIDVHGARIVFPRGWGLVRASNTQDVLVLRFEAEDARSLDSIRTEVEAAVRQAIEQSSSD